MSQRLLMNAPQMSFMRNIPLLNGLTEEEKDLFLKDGDVYTYPRRNTLFIQGDPASSFYVVCKGVVQLFRSTPNGREVTTSIRIAGDAICEREVFEQGSRYSVNAMAVDNVDVMELPLEKVKRNVEKYNVFSRNLLSAITRSAALAEIEIEHQANMTAVQLLVCYLQHLCVFHGFDPRGFTLPYKKSLIASRLGMEIETLSRAFPKLKEHGITVKGAHISFHDFQAVDKHTCGNCSVNEFCSAYQNIRKKAAAGRATENQRNFLLSPLGVASAQNF